ncbi:MAG: DUF29 domain-containing protein [Cyanobacteria bacterium P01_F01_bin.143]
MDTLKQLCLYDRDYYLWLETTVQQLKNGSFNKIDLANLIEEVESLGRKERAELRNRLKILFEHLLKLNYWEQEKEWNQRGWNLTIEEQKLQITRLIADSPSLKSHLDVLSQEAYEDALKITKLKTELDNLPENNPFDLNFLNL